MGATWRHYRNVHQNDVQIASDVKLGPYCFSGGVVKLDEKFDIL